MPPLQQILVVAAAGAFGAAGRFVIDSLVAARFDEKIWGTLVVNVAGCFVLGWLTARLGTAAPGLSDRAVMTGFLGAFTTYSTFGVQTMALVSEGRPGWAAGNVALQLVLGLGAAWVGLRVG